MAKSDEDFYKRINKEVMRSIDDVNDQKTYDSLQRLANSTTAKVVWLELSNKTIKHSSSYKDVFNVARAIGRWSIGGYLEGSQKLTSQEIKKVSNKAIKLASELRILILENSILRFYGQDLMPEDEAVALSRIKQGLINQACELNHNNPSEVGRIFSKEIEAEIDETQAQNHPEFKDMTSMDAYKILNRKEWLDESFIESLEQFEKQVKNFTPKPILPRPKKELADENVYAMMVCEILNSAYGTPCLEIATNLCTAFYNHDFEVETIKKWWHRRDTSQ
jgi:hypothetical protein